MFNFCLTKTCTYFYRKKRYYYFPRQFSLHVQTNITYNMRKSCIFMRYKTWLESSCSSNLSGDYQSLPLFSSLLNHACKCNFSSCSSHPKVNPYCRFNVASESFSKLPNRTNLARFSWPNMWKQRFLLLHHFPSAFVYPEGLIFAYRLPKFKLIFQDAAGLNWSKVHSGRQEIHNQS